MQHEEFIGHVASVAAKGKGGKVTFTKVDPATLRRDVAKAIANRDNVRAGHLLRTLQKGSAEHPALFAKVTEEDVRELRKVADAALLLPAPAKVAKGDSAQVATLQDQVATLTAQVNALLAAKGK